MTGPAIADRPISLTEHLKELRRRLLWSFSAILIGTVVAFAFTDIVMVWLRRPLRVDLVFLSPAEAFWADLKVSIFTGFFLVLPVVLYQLWRFIEPGLLPPERRFLLLLVAVSYVSFVLGVAFCYVVVLPFAFQFLIGYGQAHGYTPMISVERYVDFVLRFVLAFGLMFELPLVLTILSRMGLVTVSLLRRGRKYAVLVAFILGALLTPTPDVFNQTLVAVPLFLLYEVGIVSVRLFGRRPVVHPLSP